MYVETPLYSPFYIRFITLNECYELIHFNTMYIDKYLFLDTAATYQGFFYENTKNIFSPFSAALQYTVLYTVRT